MGLDDVILRGGLCFAISACGGDDSGNDGDLNTEENTAETGDDGAGNGDDGKADGGQEDDPTIGACSRYLDCVRAATPQMLTVSIAAYGPEGTCWDLPGVTPADCHTECQAHLDRLTDAFPDVGECAMAEEPSDDDTPLADISAIEYEELCEQLNTLLSDSDVVVGACVAMSISAPGGGGDCSQVDGFCRSLTPPGPRSCAGATPPDCESVTRGEARECMDDERTRYREIASLGACAEDVQGLLTQSDVCAKLRTECPELFNGL